MKDFLNFDDVYDSILNIYKGVIEDFGYEHREDFYDLAEERATFSAIETLDSMRRYVHKKNTHMDGNFCDIRDDWNHPGFVESEVKPWGDFDAVIASIDDETISDKDLEKFQAWALDWFFTAFGTYGLSYNFGEVLSERIYEEELEIA